MTEAITRPTTVQPFIKTWFDNFKNGRITGVKCRHCGQVEFPPVPVCNECSSTDMEWVEMSGDAELWSFSQTDMGVPPYTEEPVMCGYFKLAEGRELISWLLDADGSRDGQEKLLARLPVHCRAEIKQLDDEVWWPVFRIAE